MGGSVRTRPLSRPAAARPQILERFAKCDQIGTDGDSVTGGTAPANEDRTEGILAAFFEGKSWDDLSAADKEYISENMSTFGIE